MGFLIFSAIFLLLLTKTLAYRSLFSRLSALLFVEEHLLSIKGISCIEIRQDCYAIDHKSDKNQNADWI